MLDWSRLNKLPMTERQPSPRDTPYLLSECLWEEIENESIIVDDLLHQTPMALSVVFKNWIGNLFSAVRIVLCCSRETYDKTWRHWAIQDMGVVLDTAEAKYSFDQLNGTWVNTATPSSTPLSNPTMQNCTVVFEITDHQESVHNPFRLGLALRACSDPRLIQRNSICVLLDQELPLPPDARSVTLSFITHFTAMRTWITPPSKPRQIERHFVEVLPIPNHSRQISYKELPVEILLTVFRYVAEDLKNRCWRRDLVSCALVCHQWMCSLDFLLWDLHTSHESTYHHRLGSTDIHAVARVVTERHVLARSINHLSTEYFRGRLFFLEGDSASLPSFTSSLLTILRSARNLHVLTLDYLDVSQMEALGNALCDLPALHTFSTGRAGISGVISIVQLAYCLASWPSLKSLTVHDLQPPAVTEPTTPLQPPVCTLTDLHLEKVFMKDEELIYFTMSSFRTLVNVTLDGIAISNAGLRTFLEGVSESVSMLTIHNVGYAHGAEENALDATIVRMRRLKQLSIKGSVATELMVGRRASLFRTCEASLPIVRLSFNLVPGLPATIADGEWPGWDIVKPYTGPLCGGLLRGYSLNEYKALHSRPEGYLRTIRGHDLIDYNSTSR